MEREGEEEQLEAFEGMVAKRNEEGGGGEGEGARGEGEEDWAEATSFRRRRHQGPVVAVGGAKEEIKEEGEMIG